ncbi:MAG TPA: beta-ketoacyl synthase N-terminal-like domain-containing protein [Bacteroidia bacterium]|nr:beta-ketoacyl synthase N-terminal-like domain-containing protein [Bacteroidia bacterium]
MEVFTSYHNIISPLGFTTKENYSSVLADKLCVKTCRYGKLNEQFCLSIIPDEQLNVASRQIKDALLYSKLEKLSILSIQDVLDRSRLSFSDPKTLLIYSTTKGNIDLLDNSIKQNIPKERAYLFSMANTIANYFKAVNRPLVISNACISGLIAIVTAQRLIKAGQYENILVCGGDLVTEFTVSGFKSFNALSQNPCKPFDSRRDGINLGEAVATLLITKNKNKLERSAMQIVNGASANDANHISGPSRTGDGLFQSITQTLKNNKIKIDTISAHGTATPYNDEMESVAFERAGLINIPVNSLKGYYGHTLGAAGVLETVLTLEAASENQLIKSAGFSEMGVSGKIEMITEHKKANINTILKTVSGFGGCNAAALFVK